MELFYKKLGETPLEAINRFRLERSSFAKSKIAYAGRLDPMAEGILVLLFDEECKQRDKYQKLNKIYEFEFIIGLETDSLDLMGVPLFDRSEKKVFQENELVEAVMSFKGKQFQKLPIFSSYRVNGKPLWKWSKDNLIDTIQIPEKEIEIFSTEVQDISKITFRDILNKVNSVIPLVNGNFRQDRILTMWNNLEADENLEFQIIKAKFHVSSGTYIRQVVRDLGSKLGISSVTYSINRIAVLDFY